MHFMSQPRYNPEGGDYYLEINSPAKQLKETSMNRKFKVKTMCFLRRYLRCLMQIPA